MPQHSFLKLRISPQKFNLDDTGFTLIVTAEDVADSLLGLKLRQLRSILKQIETQSNLVIFDKQKKLKQKK